MRSRSREEIVASILEASTSHINKTSVMYRSRLSYSQLVWYFTSLQNWGLIANDNGMWTVTDKG